MDEIYSSSAKKLSITDDTLKQMKPKDFLSFWKLQEKYIVKLESDIRESGGKKAQLLEKLKTVAELQDEIAKAKKSENLDSSTVPVDPMAFSLMTSLDEALVAKKQEQRQLEEEVMKCSYTAETQVGKLLIAKCQKLSAENIELRHAILEGKVAQAEAEACLKKQNRDDFLQHMQDHSEQTVELEEELKEAQLRLSDIQNCYKQLFREEMSASNSSSVAGTSSSRHPTSSDARNSSTRKRNSLDKEKTRDHSQNRSK